MIQSENINIPKRISDWEKWFPIILLFYVFAAYGVMSLWLGFYWDDWPKLLFAESIGPQAFQNIASHRPLNGLWYFISYSVLGSSPLNWHLYAIFWHWAAGLAFWYAMKLIWPNQKVQTSVVAILFVIYPGFTQSNISLTYFVHFMAFTSFFVSMGLMITAIRSSAKRAIFHILAISLSAITMLTTDYFYGLELARPIILLLVLRNQHNGQKKVQEAARIWTPYLVVFVAIAIWRSSIDTAESYEIIFFNGDIQANSLSIIQSIATAIGNLLDGAVFAWMQIFNAFMALNLRSSVNLFGLLWSLVLAIITYIFLSNKIRKKNDYKSWENQAIILGAGVLILANIPFWVAGIEISLDFPRDRLTLPMSVGSSLLVTALFSKLFKSAKLKLILFSLLIGITIGSHFQSANAYRLDGENHAAFWQQFLWRVPNITEGSSIVSHELPLKFYSDDSLTGAANLVYPSVRPESDLAVTLLYLEIRLGGRLPSLEEGEIINWNYRLVDFSGSTSKALVIYWSPPGCLRILDPIYDSEFPQLPATLAEAIHLSKPEIVIQEDGIPGELPNFIGSSIQSKTSWCYYFQKADLARQREDWAEIARLGNIAFNLTDSPNHASERLPFIEGYARSGHWQKAIDLTAEAYEINRLMQPMLCLTWQRITAAGPTANGLWSYLPELEDLLACDLSSGLTKD